MTNPLVTIGITAFNSADTVARAVDSALAQTWRPLEVVVVNDCSADATPAVLARLATRHSELRVFQNESNVGVAASRNRILAEAKGAFIAFFDDDDESLEERVEVQLRRILEYERDFGEGRPVICHTARRLIYPDGSERIAATMGQREGRAAPASLPVAERILLGTPLEDGYGACPTCSQMARLDTYRSLGNFDPAFRRSEDTDFNIRLAKAGGHFVGVDRPLVVQTMNRSPDKSLAGERFYTLMLLEKHRDVADRFGLYAFCRRWIEMKYDSLEGRRGAFLLGLAGLALAHPTRTLRRLRLAQSNFGLNRTFGRFYSRDSG